MSIAESFLKEHATKGLPTNAAAKLKRLKERENELWSMARGVNEKKTEAHHDRRDLEAEKRLLLKSDRLGRYAGDIRERVANIDAALTRADEVLRDLAAQNRAKTAERDPLSRLIQAIEEWVNDHPKTTAAKTTPAPVPSIGTRVDAARFVREKIEQLDAEAHAVSTAPLTVANAKKAARAEIEALAEVGRPDCAPLVRGYSMKWSSKTATQVNGSIPVVVDDARAVLAWLHKDAMIAAVEAEVEAAAKVDGRKGYTDEKRAAELERIATEKLSAEREEEALIEAIEKEGGRFDRRPDADPRAVLGLA